MKYLEAINYIENLSSSLQSPSLERIVAFLSQHDYPENSFASLHIGGTNGKGSTVAILDSILRRSKLKVARYTGPHLLRWNERIHINGSPIEDAEFAKYVTKLRVLSEDFGAEAPHFGCLTWFEFITALAFLFFAENQVDIAVIEVGLGGRFDATNVLAKPLATGITNISLDHTQILGETLEKIAFEKAGIIKPGVPIITAADEPSFSIIKERAKQLNSLVVHCQQHNIDSSIQSALLGIHQTMNAQVALQMLLNAGLLEDSTSRSGSDNRTGALTRQDVRAGLDHVYWPGRFQIIKSIPLILDGAHNLAGIQALRDSLEALFPRQAFKFIFACYENKNALAMLDSLLKPGDRLYVSEVVSNRSTFSKTTLGQYAINRGIQATTYPSIEEALQSALKENSSQYVVATGSFATIKEIMLVLGWSSVEDGQQIS
jgi:dihydrofolate synthase / folylpolyglutamate synthase